MDNTRLEILFTPVDTLYFKGSRPHSAAGASALRSEFPPQPSSYAGAIRTRIGEALQVDWSQLNGEYQGISIADLLGDSSNTGLLNFGYPHIVHHGEKLFAAPANLLQTADKKLHKLELGNKVKCDLGDVQLPTLPQGIVGAKTLENTWVNLPSLKQIVAGKLPENQQLFSTSDLVQFESRLGIGRNNQTASVESGLLYQTEHLRLSKDMQFSIEVDMPNAIADVFIDSIKQQALQHFGGEGRSAEITVEKIADSAIKAPEKTNMLMLVSDLLSENHHSAIPLPGFLKTNNGDTDYWTGSINGVSIDIYAAAIGKPVKRGGWDIKNHRPKTMQSFIPAGSCFFIKPIDNSADIAKIHGQQLGRNTLTGFGKIICINN